MTADRPLLRRSRPSRALGLALACLASACALPRVRNDAHVVQEKAAIGTDRFAVVGGRNVHYVEAGTGQPVLLIPGAFSTYRVWNRVLPRLAEHYRVIAIDYVGAGDSDKPETGFDYTVAEQADVVAAFCRELRLEAPILAGVSYGSSIALAVAARHRDLPAMVCCIEGGAIVPAELLHYSSCFEAFGVPVLGDTVVACMSSGWFDHLFSSEVMGSAWDRLDPAAQDQIAAIQVSYFATATPSTTWRIYKAITSEIDFTAQMQGVRTPILYLYGEESRYRDVASTNVAFFRRADLAVQTFELPRGVHDLELQYPTEVARILTDRWDAASFVAMAPASPERPGAVPLPALPVE
jgi:pimeloyl-ACP methyl ester carboxylesterase